MNGLVSDISVLESTVCIGNSMYPTLKVLDILYIEHYHNREIRRGDVIVFLSPTGIKTAHRVVLTRYEGLKTRGDNNLENDYWTLSSENVIGQVLMVRRDKKMLKIYGGTVGSLIGLIYHTKSNAKQLIKKIIRPIYTVACNSGIFRLWLPNSIKPRVLYFTRPYGIEMQLLMGRKNIGSYDSENNRWNIMPPFRLFIDESSLIKKESLSQNSLNCKKDIGPGRD